MVHPAWAVGPEPTDLIALWPGERPDPAAIGARLADLVGAPLRFRSPPPSPPSVWVLVVEPEDEPAPTAMNGLRGAALVLWCEPARPLSPGELDDPGAAACRWVLGLEAILDRDDPVAGYGRALGLLAALSAGRSEGPSPAVLDVNSTTWHRREALEPLHGPAALEPPADMLWTIQAVEAPRSPRPSVWLHTHGLRRCGRPELEMLEVPASRAAEAAALMSHVGELVADGKLPDPGENLAIGEGLRITLHPWADVVPYLDATTPGSRADREDRDHNPHAAPAAVICGAEPRGRLRRLWCWPEEALDRMRDGALVYRSPRATARRAARARATWPILAAAWSRFAKAGRGAGRALVETIPSPEGEHDREHDWYELLELGGETARGRRLDPVASVDPHAGEVHDLHRDQVSDWQVITAAGRFGPDDPGPFRDGSFLANPADAARAPREQVR